MTMTPRNVVRLFVGVFYVLGSAAVLPQYVVMFFFEKISIHPVGILHILLATAFFIGGLYILLKIDDLLDRRARALTRFLAIGYGVQVVYTFGSLLYLLATPETFDPATGEAISTVPIILSSLISLGFYFLIYRVIVVHVENAAEKKEIPVELRMSLLYWIIIIVAVVMISSSILSLLF